MNKYYIKYVLKHQLIFDMLKHLNKKRINFFIDVQSIAVGFYNKQVVLVELGRYAEEGKPSDLLLSELKMFLNDLYRTYKMYDPFFVLFYDDGYCQQNKMIISSYKNCRSTLDLILDHDPEVELFRQIKRYYFQKCTELFNKKDISKVYYLKEYESDCIPHYCIMNNVHDSADSDILNVIITSDKDMLQTCKFKNTVQYVTSFKPDDNGRKVIHFDLYDDDNAISYFNKKFKRGILTAQYVPLILSLAGDKSDDVRGLKQIGYVKACDLIITHNLQPHLYEIQNSLNRMPEIIKDNFKTIERNMKVIDFEEQIKRMPKYIF